MGGDRVREGLELVTESRLSFGLNPSQIKQESQGMSHHRSRDNV